MQVDDFVKCTYSQLERQTGISKVVWSLYFNGKRGISEKTLRHIASSLDMTFADVLEGIDRKRQRNLTAS